jgi:ribosomal protein L7/L12
MLVKIDANTLVSSLSYDDCNSVIRECNKRKERLECVSLNQEEKELVDSGAAHVKVIKTLRDRLNISLVDAKFAVDRYKWRGLKQ